MPTSSYLFQLEKGLITWSLTRQPLVALFSMEVKSHSLNEGSKEATWLQALLNEIGMAENSTIIIFCDNQSCIKIIKNLIFHARIKHLKIQYHFVKEKNLLENLILTMSDEKINLQIYSFRH
jgi:hypothetical protein